MIADAEDELHRIINSQQITLGHVKDVRLDRGCCLK